MSQQAPAHLRTAYLRALEAVRIGRFQSAERQLREIQRTSPGEVNSLHLLGVALLSQGKVAAALEILERVVADSPRFAHARVDLARAYRQDGRLEAARRELRQILKERSSFEPAWLAYGDVLVDMGKFEDARFAFEQARLFDPHRDSVAKATAALSESDFRSSEDLFRDVLKRDASHLAALAGLAAVAIRAGNTRDAERLLTHARNRSAHHPLVQRALGHAQLTANRLLEAEATFRGLLRLEPQNPQNWSALGSVYIRLLRQEDALCAYEEAARLEPSQTGFRLAVGHVNKTLGRRAQCEESYRECLRLDPTSAEAYWSLADLKNYLFSDAELAAMQDLLTSSARTDRAQLHFALARALEQREKYSEAFAHYAQGNALRRKTAPFSSATFEAKSKRIAACFDSEFFRTRAPAGHPDPAPIFIVGLPRSGSTLVEQILASHSQVEGTMELHNILAMVRELDHADPGRDGYPERICALPADELTALGRRFIAETTALRSGRPRFIDKMPNNFSHVGLIHAILPNASIVDVRRHPMDACFSTYKQHFAEGQSFSYDLEDLGRYYRCYLALMDHWDAVLPGKVFHLQYEQLVRNPESTIRDLLDHCGLAFEAATLNFHETHRAVRTASSEQVRQPLYVSGVGYWKRFATDLEPLRASLGDCLQRFSCWETS
ncbi:MAG TPA: sulfotransferase [Steroidobacteraceae bacterium]|nr:sulfotransferase [Steroidobacteraceae bacterium]